METISFFSLTGKENKTFAIRMATYHTPEVLLICLSNNTVFRRVAEIWIATWPRNHPPESSCFLQERTGSLNTNMIRTTILTWFRSLKAVLIPIITISFLSGMHIIFIYYLDWWEEQIQRLPFGLPYRPRIQYQNYRWDTAPMNFIWDFTYHLTPICCYYKRVWGWCFRSLVINVNSDSLCKQSWNALAFTHCPQ